VKKRDGMHAEGKRDLREKMLVDLLRVIAAAALIGYGPSVWLAVVQRLWGVLIGDTLAVGWVICLALIPSIPYLVKVISIAVISYALGVGLILFTGPFGAGHLFIFAFVFLAALFGSIRAMVLANVLSVLTHVGFGMASYYHLVPWVQNLDSVIVISANFILVSSVLSFAAHFLIRGYAGAAQAEQNLRQMLEILLKEIEHRVKNNLQIISSMITMRSRSSINPAEIIEDIKESLAAISAVQQLLYREGSYYLVQAEDLMSTLVARFEGLYKNLDFKFTWSGKPVEIDSDRAINLGILVNEIVMNSVKHAFAEAERGAIFIHVHHDLASHSMVMEIGDNGRGMQVDESKAAGNGLKIIHALTRYLDAEVIRSVDGGVRYEFRMKVAEPQSALLKPNQV